MAVMSCPFCNATIQLPGVMPTSRRVPCLRCQESVPIRVTEVAPGMTRTEFSTTRYRGDTERAAQTYDGLDPLEAQDVAACIAFAIARPPHVNIDYLVVRPLAQASSYQVARRPS